MRWCENFSRKNGALAQRFKIKRWRTSRWRELKKGAAQHWLKKIAQKKTYGAVLQYNYFEYFNKLLFPNLQPWPWVGTGTGFSYHTTLGSVWILVFCQCWSEFDWWLHSEKLYMDSVFRIQPKISIRIRIQTGLESGSGS